MIDTDNVEREKIQTLMLDDVLKLNSLSRIIAAKDKLDCLMLSLSKYPNETVSKELLKHKKMLEEMVFRESEAQKVLVLADVDGVDSSWSHGSSLFGIHTHYKLTDEGSIMIRLEGELDNLPLFEQLAVIHEVDLFHEWMPFCNASSCIEKIGPSEIVAYLSVNLPPITRDALLRAYGVDCMAEEGKILLIGGSIDDWILQSTDKDSTQDTDSGLRIPLYPSDSTIRDPETSPVSIPDLQKTPWKKPPGWFHDRMIIKDFKSIISVKGPNTAKTGRFDYLLNINHLAVSRKKIFIEDNLLNISLLRYLTVILARVDPKIALPQPFINFIIKNIAGVFLGIFQRQVAKV
jgi:hypothetical protein